MAAQNEQTMNVSKRGQLDTSFLSVSPSVAWTDHAGNSERNLSTSAANDFYDGYELEEYMDLFSMVEPEYRDASLVSINESGTVLSTREPGTKPNDPNPLLDSPSIYHAVKRNPTATQALKTFHTWRWKASYPLQKRLPFHIGVHLTWGEVLLLVPFFAGFIAAIIYSGLYPSVSASGQVARLGLIFALILAQRNSVFTFIMGMPVDRAIFYHKLAGRFAGVAGILHTLAFCYDPKFKADHQQHAFGGAFTGSVNTSGSVIMILVVAIIVTSLQRVRQMMFETFFYLHYIFVLALVGSAFFHSGIVVPILAALSKLPSGVSFYASQHLLFQIAHFSRLRLRVQHGVLI
jgi:Ferric reductase like transmembrane component